MRLMLQTAVFVALMLAIRADAQDSLARLKQIEADVASAQAAWEKAAAALPEWHQADADVERLRVEADRKHREGITDAFEIAKADPQADVGFRALEWLLRQAPSVYYRPEGMPAIDLMRQHHALNPKIGYAMERLALLPPYGLPTNEVKPSPAYASVLALMKTVAAGNPDRSARAQAELGLAFQTKRAFEHAQFKRLPDAESRRLAAVRAFEALDKSYGDCDFYTIAVTKRKITDRAREELFDLTALQPSDLAPEIVGDDLQGARFKLSDYRGKVVLLVFWASWCGPCMAEVPHERKLVEQFKGRPFVLIGVNGDGDKAKADRAIATNQIPWRSFWNGPENASGPISSAWNVHGWPTVYVIDHKGVIRGQEGRELDVALIKVVEEAEAATKNTARP